jgi:hypothetical protein
VAFLCSALDDEATWRPTDLGALVPRVWSNHGAAHSRNPCAGSTREPYFNAAPVMTGTATNYNVFAHGVQVAPGATTTIPLHLFGDEGAGTWSLSAVERADLAADPQGVLSFSFDEDEGRAGAVVHLTIARKATMDRTLAPVLAFEIVSARGSVRHDWLVAVGTDTY